MSEDINVYLQKALDCLIDAETLLAGNRNEAACNRAYYANKRANDFVETIRIYIQSQLKPNP
jgi:uncharacterized protein (UPF0332 family)